MTTIPTQLKNKNFRFIKLKEKGKEAIEKEWTTKKNYAYDDPALLKWLEEGGNCGVVCGYGDLVVVDSDTQEVDKACEALPQTFSVKTAHGRHRYYICHDLEKPIRLTNEKQGDLGDVRFKGQYVVGPGSVHPEGAIYTAEGDTPIATISAADILGAVQQFLEIKPQVDNAEEEKKLVKSENEISIANVASLSKLQQRGSEYFGAHPAHGSKGGMNFWVNTSRNVWHCFRHGTGGGPLSLIAVQEGLLDCSQARSGALRGQVFKKVLQVAQEKYGLYIEKPAKQEAAKEDEKEEFDIKWVLPEDVYLFVDQFGEANAAVNRDGHREVHAVRRRGFKTLLTDWLMKANYAPTPHRVGYCADICEALALNNGNKAQLFVRAARTSDGTLWLDLCNDEYSAVKITPGSWEVVKDPPILFKRYNHMLPIVIEPGTKQDLDDFVALLNFNSDNDRLLYKVTITTNIISGIPHPIEIVTGHQGSAKTSCGRYTRQVIDNSVNLTMALPRNNVELVQQLAHNYFPVYDNVRDMQDWQQDALCRACTGEGFSKRALFTDDDDFIYKYKRVVALNGINTPGANPDFIDRGLMFTLARIAPANRLREEDIEPKVEALAPKVLGYLCEVVAKALELLHEIPDRNLPRMADFAYYGEACARVMGYAPGEFMAAYEANRRTGTQEVVTNSLIGGLVVDFAEQREDWTGTPTEFYNEVQELAKDSKINTNTKDFPKSPAALSRKLNRLIPNLEELGIKVELSTTGTVRTLKIMKYVTVVCNADLPEFMGKDAKTRYGPYKNGEIVTLPSKEAAILVAGGKVKAVQGGRQA